MDPRYDGLYVTFLAAAFAAATSESMFAGACPVTPCPNAIRGRVRGRTINVTNPMPVQSIARMRWLQGAT